MRGRIWIYSLRKIKAGDELTYNYGFDADTWDDHPCRCGSANCVGYIVERKQWPKLLRILQKLERDAATGKPLLKDATPAPAKKSKKATKARKK